MSDLVTYTVDGNWADGDDGSGWKYQLRTDDWVMVRPPIPTTPTEPPERTDAYETGRRNLLCKIHGALGLDEPNAISSDQEAIAAIEALKAQAVPDDAAQALADRWREALDLPPDADGEDALMVIEAFKDRIRELEASNPEVIYATPIRDGVWAGQTKDHRRIEANIGDEVPVVEADEDGLVVAIHHPNAALALGVRPHLWRICKVPEKNDA